MSQYKAGTWIGTVTDYGIPESTSAYPQVYVTFDVASDPTVSMTWFGSLKEGKAREITLKALLTLGFQGKDVDVLLDGPDSGAIPIGAQAKLVCEEQEWEGTPSVRIKWINSLSGGQGVKRADATTAKAALLKLNIKGDLARVKAENPNLVNDNPF